jgi:Fe-S cluster assembly ATP-binding protein
VITQYQRLLDHIHPDVVHIMAAGRIIKTGGPELALEVEQNGYAVLRNSFGNAGVVLNVNLLPLRQLHKPS